MTSAKKSRQSACGAELCVPEHLDEQYRSGARAEELGINLTYTGVQKRQKMQRVPFRIIFFRQKSTSSLCAEKRRDKMLF